MLDQKKEYQELKQRYKDVFNDIYDKYLKEYFLNKIDLQKKFIRQHLLLDTLFIIIVVSIFYNPFKFLSNFDPIIIPIKIFALIWIWVCLPSLSEVLKNEILNKILIYFGKTKYLKEQNIFSINELKSSELFSTFNKLETKDSFISKYQGVDMKISEIELGAEGHGQRRFYAHCFSGIVIKMKTNKKFKSFTIVSNKNDIFTKNTPTNIILMVVISMTIGLALAFAEHLEKLLDPMLLMFLIPAITPVIIALIIISFLEKHLNKKNQKHTGKLQRINLEDPVFNKYFKVYSEDQIEARYIITSAFMERFKNLQTAFGSKNIKCSFYEDYVIFAISLPWWKNAFEIGNTFTSLKNKKHIENFFEEIISILLMVDYFKFDEKTGL